MSQRTRSPQRSQAAQSELLLGEEHHHAALFGERGGGHQEAIVTASASSCPVVRFITALPLSDIVPPSAGTPRPGVVVGTEWTAHMAAARLRVARSSHHANISDGIHRFATVTAPHAATIAVIGFLLSVLFVRDTVAHVAFEQADQHPGADGAPPTLRSAFARATYREPALRSCSQAGLVNNLNDGLAWGLVPLFLAAHGAGVADIGLIAAIYPAVWSVAQIATGAWSDSLGRKPLIAGGMLVQALALALLAPQRRQAGSRRRRSCSAGRWHSDGLPDPDRRHFRFGRAGRACSRGWRLSLLARHGLRLWRADRRGSRRRARLQRRDRARGSTDRRIRTLGAARYAR